MKLGWVLILFLFQILNAFSDTFDENAKCETKLFEAKNTKRIVVVSHGFNNLPSEMSSIVRDLNFNHLSVVLVCLKGHGLDDPEFKNVTAQLWIQDVENAIEYALRISKKISEENLLFNVPIDYLGFSLGALTYENISPKIKAFISKRVYLSPAFKLKIKNTDPFKKIDNSFWLPSFTPAKYRANRKTRFAAYKSLFELSELIDSVHFDDLPTIVYVNPKDEMIKISEIKQMISSQNLTNWNILEVERSTDSKYKINHLIVDEQTLGLGPYKKMISEIIEFLNY